jgi:alpha-L-rhamnosidase
MQPFTRDTVRGLVLMSDMPQTGEFECSNSLLNQLQSNIQWGQRSNFLEVPTDCPQRDERLGWTGDAQVFAPTAAYNMNVAAFFTKWSRDCDDAQLADGRMPCIAPKIDQTDDGGPGWSDARVICPWTMYLAYADRRQLERHYALMQRWLEWQVSTLNDHGIRCDDGCGYFAGFSDWLSLDNTWQSVWSATPKDFIGTAYFAHAAGIMRDIAGVLGHADDAKRFAAHRERAVAGFNREFVTPSGRLSVQTQTAYLLALGFDLLPESLRAPAFQRLLKLFEERDWHLSTGFLGTPMICPVLTRFGRADVAYKILLQEDYPGWLFPVKNGATTMWERWNSWTPDKGFGDAKMNSFNHYAYGAIGRWMYDTIAGIAIDPKRPGYRHVLLRPIPGGGLTHARGAIDTVRGRVESAWKLDGARFSYDVTLPGNTTATLTLPDGSTRELLAGRHHFECTLKSEPVVSSR